MVVKEGVFCCVLAMCLRVLWWECRTTSEIKLNFFWLFVRLWHCLHPSESGACCMDLVHGPSGKRGVMPPSEGWASAQTSWSCILEEDGCFSLQGQLLILLVFLCSKFLSSISLWFILSWILPRSGIQGKGLQPRLHPECDDQNLAKTSSH